MTKFYVGTTLRHTVNFFDTDGTTLVDPATVTLRRNQPFPGVELPPLVFGVDSEIVRTGVGVFYIDELYELSGRHSRRWECTGPVIIHEEWTRIEPSRFTYTFDGGAPANLVPAGPVLGTPTLTENP